MQDSDIDKADSIEWTSKR